MGSLRTALGQGLDIVFGLVLMVAVVALAVAVAAFGRGAVRFLEARPGPPRAAMTPVRCHWHGRWLIARAAVVNLTDRDATFVVMPQISVAGIGRRDRETDALYVRGNGAADWRWANGESGVPPGTAVTRCSATVSFPSRNEGDD